MNFFLDENFQKKAAILLEGKKHVVFDIRGTSQEGLFDLEIIRLAKKKKAIFLTTDRDFSHSIHYTVKPHHGIVVITLRKPDADSILDKLKWILDNISLFEFENRCFLLTDGRCTVFE